MSSTPLWPVRLRHMLEAIAECQRYVHGLTQEHLGADARTLDAIAWRLTVLGEAARHIPDDVTSRYPDIPWAKIRGMRTQIVHGYDQIDPEIVWKVVLEQLPPLVPHLEQILNEAVE